MRGLLLASLWLAGCGGAAPPSSTTPPATPEAAAGSDAPTPPADRRRAACDGDAFGNPSALSPPLPVHGTVVEVAVEGLARLDEAALRRDIRTEPGTLDPKVVAADIHRLFERHAIADLSVVAVPTHEFRDDLRLVYRVVELPSVGEIFLDGDVSVARDLARRIESEPLVEPRRVHTWTREVLDELHRRGHRRAALRVSGHRRASGTLDLCVHAEPGPKATVARWEIRGVSALPKSVLDPIYALAGIGEEGAVLDDLALERARLELQAAYWNHGHLESTIAEPVVTPVGEDLTVTIEVVEGPVYRHAETTVDGHAKAAYPRIVAPLKKGAVFDRSVVMKVVEALREYHQGEKLEVEVQTHLDEQGHSVDLELKMVPPGTLPQSVGAP